MRGRRRRRKRCSYRLQCCHQLYQRSWGYHSRGFLDHEAARDIIYASAPLISDSGDIYVYGSGVGSILATRVMYIAPKQFKGYILDRAMSELKSGFTRLGSSREDTAMRLASRCDHDSACRSKYGDDLLEKQTMADVWLALAPQLDDADNAYVDLLCGDCENVAPSDMLRILLDVGIPVSSTSTRGEIPAVMQWLGRCNDTDVEKLRSRLEIPEGKSFYDAWNDLRAEQGTAVAEPGTPSTQMLTQIIKHSEFWFHPSVSWEKEKKWIQESSFGINQVQDYAWHCVLSGNTSDPSCTALKDYGKQLASPMDFSKITNTLPFLYQRDEYSNKYATIPEGASVLLMSGKLDFEFLPAGPMISLSI